MTEILSKKTQEQLEKLSGEYDSEYTHVDTRRTSLPPTAFRGVENRL